MVRLHYHLLLKQYQNNLDIVSVENDSAILIRDGQIADIVRLSDYQFIGLPVLDERGFALTIKHKKDLEKFLQEFALADKNNHSDFHNKWFQFEVYRKIVCTDNFWMI